jgi:uncharacterized protein
VVHSFQAASAAGGTAADRPEDIEVHPRDGSIYIAFTNNGDRGIPHGYIVRLEDDPGADDAFQWDVFAFGGPAGAGGGFSAPDNLVFDAAGNLWIVTDISTGKIAAAGRDPEFASFGNNGVFFCATDGPDQGRCYQFASAPVEAEATGPTWSPGGKSLFLSIQHPGEDSSQKGLPFSSHWPDGGDADPRPPVVAIRGF